MQTSKEWIVYQHVVKKDVAIRQRKKVYAGNMVEHGLNQNVVQKVVPMMHRMMEFALDMVQKLRSAVVKDVPIKLCRVRSRKQMAQQESHAVIKDVPIIH